MTTDLHPLPTLDAAVLVGGASGRMGTPKHLIMRNGRTWLEAAVETVSPLVRRVVLVGEARVPPNLLELRRIDDVPYVKGPFAGILAVLRHDPRVAWLVLACDLPCLSADALRWLIDQRRVRASGVIPVLADRRPQPLLAVYEPTAIEAVESLVQAGRSAPRELAELPGFLTPSPAIELQRAWTNVNTPDELAAFEATAEGV